MGKDQGFVTWRDIDDVLAASGQHLDGDPMPIYEAVRAMGIEVWLEVH
jgi:hypothetical protein